VIPEVSGGRATLPLRVFADLIMGQAPVGDSYNDTGHGLPLIAGAGDLGQVTPKPKKWTDSPTKVGQHGDIIVCVRATIGDLNWADRPYCYGRGVAAVRVKSGCEPHFIWYWLEACKQHLQGLGRGATFKQISKEDLAELPTPDLPLPEQRRIVSRIKACMERVEEIERDAAVASREIDALFPAVLNERFDEIRAAHGLQALEQAAVIRGGGSLPKGTSIDQGDESVLLVKVGDMNIEGNERVISVAREFLTKKEAGRNTIPAGAVVLPKRGGAIATNKKRMLGRPALIDPNLMAIVARQDVLRAEYLYYWCLTLDLATLSNGGVIPQLNRKDLAPLQVPMPPLDAQQHIVESLKRSETYCGQLRAEFDAAQAERAQLRESILRKAFAGEL